MRHFLVKTLVNCYECIEVNRVPVICGVYSGPSSVFSSLLSLSSGRQRPPQRAALQHRAYQSRWSQSLTGTHEYSWARRVGGASCPRAPLHQTHGSDSQTDTASYAITLLSPWQTIATHLLPPRPGARGEVTKHATPQTNCSDHFRVNLGCFTFNSSQLKQLCTVQNSNSVIYSLSCHTKEDILMIFNLGCKQHWSLLTFIRWTIVCY